MIIGVGLLACAVYAYDVTVVRPQSWPQSDALIVSSRVVNPKGPDTYAPQLVFRLDAGGSTRDVTIAPSWSSNSYEMVHGHVARFPAGAHVKVAVNPADPGDLRYDLTLSITNLLLPGILGLLGLGFAGGGALAWRAASRARELQGPAGYTGPIALDPADLPVDADGRPMNPHLPMAGQMADVTRLRRRVPLIFALIGAILLVIGAMMARSDLAMLRDWPAIDAQVVESSVVTRRSSSQNSKRSYDTSVKFRYAVNGVTYENATTHGLGSSSQSSAAARAEAYAPGTVHKIWHRPDDPNLIRFDLDSPFTVFFASGALILMGVVFLAVGVIVGRSSRSSFREASNDAAD